MNAEDWESDWLDEEAGPVVRPYAITGGRVDPAGFDLIAHVVATVDDPAQAQTPEKRAILAAAERPCAVVEVAAVVDLPLGVVRVLLADLHAEGLIERYDPPSTPDGPTEQLLQAVIHGLRTI
ncbi:hypothetical protein HDA40_000980 [Hamadaea flava]|uniref:DUF742 domain-containing protein n=1 Tax=Hamadaea flava TaxID=1742688 RepID=A0ABV8LPH1_9ACTN|nr:DUF742 domain-containing protein [Hamadaea flava]MCP2322473.1 hypothetical protein [Hamadaea flava]